MHRFTRRSRRSTCSYTARLAPPCARYAVGGTPNLGQSHPSDFHAKALPLRSRLLHVPLPLDRTARHSPYCVQNQRSIPAALITSPFAAAAEPASTEPSAAVAAAALTASAIATATLAATTQPAATQPAAI